MNLNLLLDLISLTQGMFYNFFHNVKQDYEMKVKKFNILIIIFNILIIIILIIILVL